MRILDNGQQIMKADAYTAVDGCVYRPNWKMARCSQKYAKVYLTPAVKFLGLNFCYNFFILIFSKMCLR